ncbi:MAG: type II toxin-antitoxin system VapC family toxin [Verrucomicrobia bacterium]|nr:type II toxin-antitoxin system VapC family toxin [Verrucomicrobiota bacterium]
MNPKAPQLLAADANVALDLAQENDWVLDALATIRARLAGCSLLVPPTVSEELAWLADHADESKTRTDARKFLRHHRTWGFELIRAIPVGDAYVEKVADRLLQAALLPSTEANDARILAESAALGCFILLTSDEHLRAVDFQRLGFELAAFDLTAPVIATPREIVRKFFR